MTSGKSFATWLTTSRQSCETINTLALSTDVSFLRRLRATSKPTRAMRSISREVYAIVLIARAPPSANFSIPRGSPKYSPPVSSRMTMRSVPSTTERLSGDESTSMGNVFAGRRFAYRSSSLRSASNPRSGFSSCGKPSHFGPPTEPNMIAVALRQSSRLAGGSGVPVASMAHPPTSASSNSSETPACFPTVFKTLTASPVTSGPMPSPASTAIRWVAMAVGALGVRCAEGAPVCCGAPMFKARLPSDAAPSSARGG